MPKKVTLTFTDQTYATIAQSAGETPLSQFLQEAIERQSVVVQGEAQVGRLIDARVNAAVSERLKEQTYVELETAERVAERVLKWAKIAGVLLAIPAAILVAVFSILGIKTYSDLQEFATEISNAEKTVTLAGEIAEQTQANSRSLIAQTEALRSQLAEAEAVVARVRDLEQQVPQLSTRQAELEEAFKEIAGGIKLTTESLRFERSLEKFVLYLESVGFPASDVDFTVTQSEVESVYFEPQTRTIHFYDGAPDYQIISVYSHYFMRSLRDSTPSDGFYTAMLIITSEYYVSSFLDSSNVPEEFGYQSVPDVMDPLDPNVERFLWGEILWKIRSLFGQSVADNIPIALWNALPAEAEGKGLKHWYSVELLKEALARAEDDELGAVVRQMWEVRGLSTS